MVGRWARIGAAMVAMVAWLLVLGGGGQLWPGVPVSRADHVPVTTWRLSDIVTKDADGRGAQAGRVTVLESTVNAQGGTVVMSTRWDEVCNQAQRFRFRWQFTQDIRQMSKGQTLSATFSLEADGGNICDGAYTNFTGMTMFGDGDGSGTPALEQLGIRDTGPNSLFFSPGKTGSFMANPQHSAHLPGPRTLQVDTRFSLHRGFFKVDLATRAGWFYETVYLYDAVFDGGGNQPPPTSGGNQPPPATGGAQPPGGAGGPPPGTTNLGGIDLNGYCQDDGYDSALLSGGQWFCLSNDTGTVIDMDDVCQWQYGDDGAYARQTEAGNPLSWLCYTGGSSSGGSSATAPPAPPPPANPPPGACGQWDVSGTWQVVEQNGYRPTFTLQQAGTTLTGTATLSAADQARAGYASSTGSIAGTVSGTTFDVVVTWPPKPNGYVARGHYTGAIGQGTISGTGYDEANPGGASETWSAVGPTTCRG